MTFECDKCGLCCRKLIIEIRQIDVVREPKLLQIALPCKTNYGEEYWDQQYILACGSSHPCKALVDNHCSIYPTRPNCCVGFEAGSEECQELREENGLEPLECLEDREVQGINSKEVAT